MIIASIDISFIEYFSFQFMENGDFSEAVLFWANPVLVEMNVIV